MAAPLHPTSPRAADRRVLIVDDDVDLAESLQEVLESRGYVVASAGNIADAVDVARAFAPQVAMLDVNLGRENGLTLITTLKELLPETLCVVISARSDFEYAIDALRRGAFDYLPKPLHPMETLARLEKCFEKLALEERAQRAEAASQAKSAFLAVISHELRTPLNAIIGFAEILQSEAFGPLGADRYKDYINDIHGSGCHLLEIITEILDLTRAEAGTLELHEDAFDLGETLQECAAQVTESARAADLTMTLTAGPPCLLVADHMRIRQVVHSLLTNAIKFTPRGGHIELFHVLRDDGGIDIEVRDSGIGMAPADIPIALRPFTQVDGGLTRRYEGMGLGLPLTAALVQLHGGNLALQSKLGEGTVATASFPPSRTIRDRDERGQFVNRKA
jgi:signal transduction histidine kinase